MKLLFNKITTLGYFGISKTNPNKEKRYNIIFDYQNGQFEIYEIDEDGCHVWLNNNTKNRSRIPFKFKYFKFYIELLLYFIKLYIGFPNKKLKASKNISNIINKNEKLVN